MPEYPAPTSPLRVAAVQATPVPGDVAGNAVRAARLVGEAADRGARLAVLPELFLPAYHPPTLAADPGTDVAADPSGLVADGRLAPLAEAARRYRIVVAVGAAVRHADGRRACAVLLAEPSGTVRAAYDKQHLWGPDENALFTPGRRGATVELDGWALGLGVCYDGCFPEHARAAALDGAHAYLCPSGYVTGSEHRRDLYYRARALDNTMYVVFANLVGGDGDWVFNGGSAVHDPQGRPVVRADDAGQAVVVAELSPVQLSRTRFDHTMLIDRRDGLTERVRLPIPA